MDVADEQAASIRREVELRRDLLAELTKDRKRMPRFVVKDMETLYVDEVPGYCSHGYCIAQVRASINLLHTNLESVPIIKDGRGQLKKNPKSRYVAPYRNPRHVCIARYRTPHTSVSRLQYAYLWFHN